MALSTSSDPIEPAPEQEAALRPLPSKIDSPGRTLLGLMLIWFCLWLVFTANRWSDAYLRMAPGNLSGDQDHSLIMSLEPRVKILQPIELHFPRMSSIQALQNIGSYVRLGITPESLQQVRDRVQSYEYRGVPLYAVIHDLLDDDELGFALRNNDLQVFRQKLKTTGADPAQELHWEARLELTPQRLLIFPSGQGNIWFSARMIGTPEVESRLWDTVQVEIWKGGELLTVSRATLDEKGNALLSMSTTENITLQIQRVMDNRPERPTSYDINFHYQSFN